MYNQAQIGVERRNEYADALRGFAAVLVITGHLMARDFDKIAQPNYFYSWIYCVHMPAFFFFAGLFAETGIRKSFPAFLRQKIFRLLIPYITWSSVAVAAKAALAIVQGHWDPMQTLRQLGCTLFYGKSMWFFLSLFTMHLLFLGIARLWEKNRALAVLTAIVCWILPLNGGSLSLHNTQSMMLYYALGMLAAKHKKKISACAAHKYAVIAAAAVLCAAPLYIVKASELRLDYGLRLIMASVLSALTAGSVCILMGRLMHAVAAVRRVFFLFGKYSMEMYCIHMLFVNYLPLHVPESISSLPEIAVDAIYFLIALAVGFICVVLSAAIFNKIPVYRWFMLGQWPQANKEERLYENVEK